ncbi:MAG: hypothetical protein K9I85_07870 [Saprospiraceae bacterium]|nr:hypothetical protein [Saprospiraceae bacterium]
MAQNDLPIADRLKQLYKLQIIDSQIDEIEILKGELPMEVNDLEDEVAGLQTRTGKLDQQIKDIEAEISKHKANIKESEALIEKYDKQMTNVKNNREYEALSKELEMQKLEIQLSEKKYKEMEVQKEAKVETLKATQERVNGKQADLKIKKDELEGIIAKTEKEEKDLNKKSETAKKKIDERLLKAYNKIRESYRNKLAVVPITRSSCGGCFNFIPPQMALEIGLHKKVVACEHCGRILIDDSIIQDVAPQNLVES